ncbi:serine/threonine protein kinase [Nocardia sp. 2]|uniref:non-specific serine/threonine protein kinase n=1 Tax=Nocardia acididurans TaxID=2802282 RepID=A0ABS1M239_9NOCA|nr:serine/threonine-protein kinase [Nocardia acididurans]MBL1073884.1 serine/threonine protein kinase [Nocardia acididurans]
MAEPGPGQVFAGYRIDRVLGVGGMGAVYLAKHPRLPRHEALKVLPLQHGLDRERRARFAREAELVARLDHPNVVAVRDRGFEGGFFWIAMELVDGTDAAALIRRNPSGLPAPVALHILTEAAHGLDAAHALGILHRDVKPANILLETRSGSRPRVYVSDFGIARPITETTALTETGAVLATLAYAAPEQVSDLPLDRAADVYALGCTFFELLTGSRPFPYPAAASVVWAHLHEPLPKATDFNPDLPVAIDEVIARATAKDPSERYSGCGEFASAAAAALEDAAPTRADPGPHRASKRILAACVVIGLTLAMIAAAVVLERKSPPDSLHVAPDTTTVTGVPVTGRLTWGAYASVVQRFPDLLPSSPVRSGHGGVRCGPVDAAGNDLPATDSVPDIARIRCLGNRDPLDRFVVACRTDAADAAAEPESDTTIRADEVWQRGTESGTLRWGDRPAIGTTEGVLLIEFDAPAKESCWIHANGGTTGRDLLDSWWQQAPI